MKNVLYTADSEAHWSSPLIYRTNVIATDHQRATRRVPSQCAVISVDLSHLALRYMPTSTLRRTRPHAFIVTARSVNKVSTYNENATTNKHSYGTIPGIRL